MYNQIQIKPLFGDNPPWKKEQEEEKIDVEQIKEEAYLRGLKEGIEQGKKEAEEYMKKKIEALKEEFNREKTQLITKAVSNLNKIAEEIAGIRADMIKKAEEDILRIVFVIAQKIIKAEISCNKEILINNIKEALTNAVDKDRIIIRVHPEDYEYLSSIDDLRSLLDVEDMIIQKDDSVKLRGGCIVETKYSEIDARIETQLKKLESEIMESKR